MTDPLLGQISTVGFNFAPRGWALCNGQLLAISQNSALFSLLGTIYGGDGRTTFGLPDLRGRAPINAGNGPGLSNIRLGQKGGQEFVTLNNTQLPNHSHIATGSSNTVSSADTAVRETPIAGDVPSAANYKSGFSNVGVKAFGPANNTVNSQPVAAPTIGATGGNQPFSNRNPFLGVNYVIALVGVYPSRG